MSVVNMMVLGVQICTIQYQHLDMINLCIKFRVPSLEGSAIM